MLQSILWHVRISGIAGILNHRQAPIPLYPPQTGAPVIKGAAQYHTDNAFTVRYRCRPEKRINRGPMKVLLGAAPRVNPPIVEQNMMIRGGDVDPAGLDRLICRDAHFLYANRVAQHRCQVCIPPERHMNDDYERGLEYRR